ncbi:MAG: hypothetical protein ACLTBV_07215 [Enterocloster bolteae]
MDTCGRIFEACRGEDICVLEFKTIDNDIAITDHTQDMEARPGSLPRPPPEVGADVKALPIHVCVMEAMGRSAGWTWPRLPWREETRDAPNLIYLPERPFRGRAWRM